MSQILFSIPGGPGAIVETLTGNSGGAVGPTGNNINVLGAGVLSVAGNAGTSTLTISMTDPLPVTNGGTGRASLTNHGLLVGAGTSEVTQLGAATNGQLPIGSTGADPVLATLTAGAGISVTNGAGTITIAATGGAGIETLNGDSGSATGSTVTISGGSNITTSATGSTVTVDLDNSVTLTGALSLSNSSSSTAGVINFGGSRFISNFGTQNTFIGAGSGNFTLSGGDYNTIIGAGGNGASLTSGTLNAGLGINCFRSTTSGSYNAGVGAQCFQTINTGAENSALGYSALAGLTSGQNNVAIGAVSGQSITTGSNNVFIGWHAGVSSTTSDSNNVYISHAGVGGENNTMRIGTDANQTKCFISGIRGVTTGVADAIAVLVDSAGQLGTVSSSARVKENVRDLGKQADKLMNLRPVSFNYKTDETKTNVYGLIAEEVKELFPELVVHNKDGEVESIKYHELPILLLKKVQDLVQEINNLKEKLEA